MGLNCFKNAARRFHSSHSLLCVPENVRGSETKYDKRQRRKNKRTRSAHDEEKTQSSPCPPLFLSLASPVHIILLQSMHIIHTPHPQAFCRLEGMAYQIVSKPTPPCTVLCMFVKFVSKSLSLDLLRSNYQINTKRCRAHNLQHQQTRRPQHFSTRNVMCPCQIRFGFGGSPKTSVIPLARTYAGTNPQFLVLLALSPFRQKRLFVGISEPFGL